MPEENETGESNADAAGQPQAGVVSGTEGVPQATAPAAEGNQGEIEGLKAAAVAEREKRQAAEANVQLLKDQMSVVAANAPQTPAQPTQTLYQQIAKNLGYDDEEYLTGEQQGHVLDAMIQVVASRQAEGVFMSEHSDYEKVVGVMNVTGRFQEAPPLKRVLDKNPGLRAALGSIGDNPSAKMIAYELAVKDPQYQEELKKEGMTEEQKKAMEAEAAIKAANAPASISSVPGGGNLDKVAAINAMSDEEFRTRQQKIIDQAF